MMQTRTDKRTAAPPMAMRLKLTIAYDGRPYTGWQSQPGGKTVQDHLQRALGEIAKRAMVIHGSGRTDTGVHALGQVAHVEVPQPTTMRPSNWLRAINSKLPATIRVMACEAVPEEFHARFSACGKIYHYDICTAPVLPPHRAGLVWHLPQGLDMDCLGLALGRVCGRHDYHAFAAYRGDETAAMDYHRTLHTAELEVLADGCRITYVGDGFLYKMVRLLTGAVVKVGQGKLELAALSRLLDQGVGLPHGKSPHCAPADGLYLQQVLYPDDGCRDPAPSERNSANIGALQVGRVESCSRGDAAGSDF